eukprot:COSAG02_NODE_16229_length_1101_cov_12.473054_1_plen_73_part_01
MDEFLIELVRSPIVDVLPCPIIRRIRSKYLELLRTLWSARRLNTTHNSTSATTTPTLYHNAAEEDPVQEEGRL